MKIDQAKKYARLTLLFNVLVTIIICIVLLTAHRGIANIFTKELKVVSIIDEVLNMLVLYVFFDTIHGVQSGIIRGLGLQVYGAIWTLICYYLVGLPLALTFAFKHEMGVYGLWLGFAIACILLDIGLFFICECPNWSKIARKM